MKSIQRYTLVPGCLGLLAILPLPAAVATDREEAGLLGNVRTAASAWYRLTRATGRISLRLRGGRVVRFDAQGNLVEETRTDSRGALLSKSIRIHDTGGHLTWATFRDARGTLVGSTTNRYDARGNLVESVSFLTGGSRRDSETRTYDARGNCIEKSDYDTAGKLVRRTKLGYNRQNRLTKSACYNALGRRTMVFSYKYDARGNRIRERWSGTAGVGGKAFFKYDVRLASPVDSLHYDNHGKLQHRTILEVDARTNIISIIECHPVWKSTNRTIYRYAARGEVTNILRFASNGSLEGNYILAYDTRRQPTMKARYTAAGSLVWKHTWQYDMRGRLTEEAKYSPDGSVWSRAVYRNDAHGNPVEKKIYEQRLLHGRPALVQIILKTWEYTYHP